MLKKLLSEEKLSDINFERLKKALTYIKNNLFDSDNNMYVTVDLLIDINNIITGSKNITLRKFNVKPYVYDKMYMDKDLIEDKHYKLIDQSNERKINYKDFYFALLGKISPFYDENGRTCKIFYLLNFGQKIMDESHYNSKHLCKF